MSDFVGAIEVCHQTRIGALANTKVERIIREQSNPGKEFVWGDVTLIMDKDNNFVSTQVYMRRVKESND